MKRLLACGCALLLWPRLLAAQGHAGGWPQADYEAHFGASRPREPGPQSLEEAREQRRGYRLGQQASPSFPGMEEHVVQEGDTLWSISSRYLGDPWQWPQLWSYNPAITDPHWIYPNNRVRLTEQVPAEAGERDPAAGDVAASVRPVSTRVVVVPDGSLRPGMVFLRDQGYLDQEALTGLGRIIGAPEEHMMLSMGDHAYVRFNRPQEAGRGQEYAVFRELQAWERYPGEQGRLVRIMGTVTVQRYDDRTRVARVVISEALDVIERGFHVARVARRFDLVEPKPNTVHVRAKIVAAIRPRGLIGDGEVVFLDVGRHSGVQAGNSFLVLRRRDPFLEGIQGRESEVGALLQPPPYRPPAMPQEAVATLRVLKVRAETTVALVTRADTDLTYGDVAEMRVGF